MILRLSIYCRRFRRLIVEESGPTAVEYAVMLALIIVVCASAASSIGSAAHKSIWMVVEALE